MFATFCIASIPCAALAASGGMRPAATSPSKRRGICANEYPAFLASRRNVLIWALSSGVRSPGFGVGLGVGFGVGFGVLGAEDQRARLALRWEMDGELERRGLEDSGEEREEEKRRRTLRRERDSGEAMVV